MKRRELLAVIGSGVILAPRLGDAAGRVAHIGLLGVPPRSDPQMAPIWQAFVEVLQAKGWSLGRNLVVDRRWSGGQAEAYPAQAAELAAGRPDLIIALSSQAIEAARRQTDRIPIVATGATDLVALGVAASLARPGGNVTGFGVEQGTMVGQWLQMLKQARPQLSRAAVFFTPTNPASKAEEDKAPALALRLGIALAPIAIDKPGDFDAAFAGVLRAGADGLVVHPTPLLWGRAKEIAAFAIAHRLPTATGFPGMAHDGLMLSYSPDYADMWRRTAGVVDKILRGARPADIPIELPTKFTFVVNLKTARALEISLPQSLLARADEVIE